MNNNANIFHTKYIWLNHIMMTEKEQIKLPNRMQVVISNKKKTTQYVSLPWCPMNICVSRLFLLLLTRCRYICLCKYCVIVIRTSFRYKYIDFWSSPDVILFVTPSYVYTISLYIVHFMHRKHCGFELTHIFFWAGTHLYRMVSNKNS